MNRKETKANREYNWQMTCHDPARDPSMPDFHTFHKDALARLCCCYGYHNMRSEKNMIKKLTNLWSAYNLMDCASHVPPFDPFPKRPGPARNGDRSRQPPPPPSTKDPINETWAEKALAQLETAKQHAHKNSSVSTRKGDFYVTWNERTNRILTFRWSHQSVHGDVIEISCRYC